MFTRNSEVTVYKEDTTHWREAMDRIFQSQEQYLTCKAAGVSY